MPKSKINDGLTNQQRFLKRRKVLDLCRDCGKSRVGSKYKNKCDFHGKKATEDTIRNRKLMRKKVFDHYGNRCICCGEIELVFLTIDHIHNDGAEHKRKIGKSSGWSMYGWIVANNFPTFLQILCANCNTGKHRNKGICPHKEMQNAYS